jgi:tRNA/tmRNA/rRNA uracil-C5-methylase (TrmA/RlmC/RlmD family)
MESNNAKPTLLYLPGYEAQLNDDGPSHSKLKVETSANELSTATGFDRSRITTIPSVEEETLNYRSSCTFQIITKDDDSGSKVHYAMRQNRKAVLIGDDYFPIATPRIQDVMKLVMKAFNNNLTMDSNDDSTTRSTFGYLKNHLSSASFVSSWNRDLDCIVTFNYDQPINECEDELKLLLNEAEDFCSICNITTLILRSRKKKIIAGRKDHPFIRDVIQISIPKEQSLDTLIKTSLDNMMDEYTSQNEIITVRYRKPQDAFQHPNHNAMLHALGWMLTKLKNITYEYRCANKDMHETSLNLLEMYCGCGAHTMPIAKTGFFDSIVTIELDNRLVDACKENAEINHCAIEKSSGKDSPIHIFQGDAGEWSRKILKHRSKEEKSLFNKDYQVLLVDPPRAGLDSKVCELAKIGSFQHLIYVSCGREALKGDILKLSDSFEVADCTIIDLFPRTDSVESLVHLRRKI